MITKVKMLTQTNIAIKLHMYMQMRAHSPSEYAASYEVADGDEAGLADSYVDADARVCI